VENRKVLWTDTAGTRHVSVCGYDKASAQHRADELRGKATDIAIVTVKPGETVEVDQPRPVRIVQRKHTRSTR
jgi:hypothetical protein